MLVQPVNNYQNNYYNNSFKAQIIKTEYLMKGLEHVKHKTLVQQLAFLNFLENIKNDNDIETIRIFNEKTNSKGITKIEADGQVIYTDLHDEISCDSFVKNKDGKNILTEGGLCMNAIENFTENYYGSRTLHRLIHTADKKLRNIRKLHSKMVLADTEQKTQKYKQMFDTETDKIQKELTDRYSSFEASLTDLNQVMN